ncbi:YceD family protein [Micromonospora sp. NBC_01796]|uniref:YceD family protein n=1 Tax=Micromonospora sp. NBC_01796 TaxID=2975987 RepID=UPI002DD7D46A|nr:YceD family protein [Micromonospora sp. NBC_01796]WSA87124.1 YceD family protein [Micromonospora sp. NBC_01796]
MPKHTPSQLDPRSPLVLDTRELPRRPGALRTVTRVVKAPADLGVEMVGVPEGTDLSLDLSLQSVSEGVYVSGTVSGAVQGECGRCLRQIDDSVVVTIQELYAYANSTTDETTEEDEVGRMQGDLIDLEPALRDAVVLALPTNPLCREDCPGLCTDCGVHWDDLPADHSHQQIDPRWAGLTQLTRKEE